jgi:hypothetical protein
LDRGSTMPTVFGEAPHFTFFPCISLMKPDKKSDENIFYL